MLTMLRNKTMSKAIKNIKLRKKYRIVFMCTWTKAGTRVTRIFLPHACSKMNEETPSTHTHTHARTHTFIYVFTQREREREREKREIERDRVRVRESEKGGFLLSHLCQTLAVTFCHNNFYLNVLSNSPKTQTNTSIKCRKK